MGEVLGRKVTHTALYYTANVVPDFFANNIRNHLLTMDVPIISISCKLIDFGENICVGVRDGLTPEPSVYNVYKQLLIGAKRVKTKYVVCCEDDALYVPEHFTIRPPENKFFYNSNKWRANPFLFFTRKPIGMVACVVSTKLMIDTLEARFAKYKELIAEQKDMIILSEPGKHERKIGLPQVKFRKFKTKEPILAFDHKGSMGGERKLLPNDVIRQSLEPWGKAYPLWQQYWGKQ